MPPIEVPRLAEPTPEGLAAAVTLQDLAFDDVGYEAALPYLWRSGTADDFADSAFAEQ